MTMMLGLAACASAPVGQPVKRTLPAEGSVILAPVAEPQIRVGQDARVALAETRAALRAANQRLRASRGIYGRVRARYEAGK